MTETNGDSGEHSPELSVVDRVLTAFTTAVAEQDGLADVARRLAESLIDKKDLSEVAIQRALFEVDET